MQPGLKNLTDHFLEEWFWRPAAIASYSAGKLSGARASVMWHGTLSEMGMVVISSTLAVGPIGETLDADGKPIGALGATLQQVFPRFADDLAWWTEAAKDATLPQAAPILTRPLPGQIAIALPLRIPPFANVRFGSAADIERVAANVRFGLERTSTTCSARMPIRPLVVPP